jgi:hypothetical protein
MTAEQIRSWDEQGIEFGAHSRTHADLTKLSEADCRTEIIGSKNDLADLLGSPIVSFAYPYGEYNDAVRNIVREQFDLGLSTLEGINYLRTDPYLLRRACTRPSDGLIGFLINVWWGGQERINSWRVKLRVRTRFKRILGVFHVKTEKRTL